MLEQRAIYGPNELVPDKGTPFWKLVLKQFDDLLVRILIVAAVVDLIIAIINGETGASVFVEPGVIILILIANGVLKCNIQQSSYVATVLVYLLVTSYCTLWTLWRSADLCPLTCSNCGSDNRNKCGESH